MSIDRERLDERLDPEAIRDGLEERLDPAAVRAGLDAFYARYFLPPSVTGEFEGEERPTAADATYHEFDFTAWLDDTADGTAGPRAPPAEPRVVTDAAVEGAADPVDHAEFDFREWLSAGEAFEPSELDAEGESMPDPGAAEHAEFDFREWLAAGETFEPVEALEPEPETTDEEPTVAPADEPLVPRPSLRVGVHPAKVATYALFLAVVALAALTVVGHLPALGPAEGLAS